MTQSCGGRASPHASRKVGEAYRRRINQAPTAAVKPARVRPRATIAYEATTSRARNSCSDMVAVFLFEWPAAGCPGRRVRTGQCLDSIDLNIA